MLRKLFFIFVLFSLVSCDFIKRLVKMDNDNKPKETWDLSRENNIKFLNQNKSQSGVQVTASGLQYKVIEQGSGKSPKSVDRVEVHYRGTLINGKEFDSSYKRGQTASFGLNQVIAGWTEGLQLMKEGGVFEFYIPSQLAYGERALPQIPAGSTLIFKVELIKIL